MLRYQPERDLYLGSAIAVDGEAFTDALDGLVKRGYEPAAAVDLLVRETSWIYGGTGVTALRRCRQCGALLDAELALPYCSLVCEAAHQAGKTWQDAGGEQ